MLQQCDLKKKKKKLNNRLNLKLWHSFALGKQTRVPCWGRLSERTRSFNPERSGTLVRNWLHIGAANGFLLVPFTPEVIALNVGCVRAPSPPTVTWSCSIWDNIYKHWGNALRFRTTDVSCSVPTAAIQRPTARSSAGYNHRGEESQGGSWSGILRFVSFLFILGSNIFFMVAYKENTTKHNEKKYPPCCEGQP